MGDGQDAAIYGRMFRCYIAIFVSFASVCWLFRGFVSSPQRRNGMTLRDFGAFNHICYNSEDRLHNISVTLQMFCQDATS